MNDASRRVRGEARRGVARQLMLLPTSRSCSTPRRSRGRSPPTLGMGEVWSKMRKMRSEAPMAFIIEPNRSERAPSAPAIITV